MLKSVNEWDEDFVLGLPAESDELEKKGRDKLDIAGNPDALREELAKQLSAFANMSGGHVVYGIANDGSVDNGGVNQNGKGRQSTKEWLENVIPTLTEFEITGVRVREILPHSSGSRIAHDKCLIVVEIPASDRAPHQSTHDRKYYVRLGSTSVPAPHRMIEDIRNRLRHPLLTVTDIQITRATYRTESPMQPGNICQLSISIRIKNCGTLRASNVCVALTGMPLRITSPGGDTLRVRLDAGLGTALVEFNNSIYPTMEVGFSITAETPGYVNPSGSLDVGELTLNGILYDNATVQATIYADSAPPVSRTFSITDLDRQHLLGNAVQQHLAQLRRARETRGER